MDINENNKKWCIYFHINKANNKSYIGVTSLKLRDRFGKNGNNYKHNKYFSNAIEKYGWDNFEHIVFMDNLSKEDACKIEILLIKLWKTNNRKYGYNLSIGGEMSAAGVKHTEEYKKKMSESRKGENNPMYGEMHTNEWKQMMSYRMSGKNNYWYGKHISEESKKKMSESHKGISAWNKGKKMDDSYAKSLMKPVYCYELDMYFRSVTEAGIFVGIGNQHITECCKGKIAHTGRHPETNERLSWRYATKKEYENWKNI